MKRALCAAFCLFIALCYFSGFASAQNTKSQIQPQLNQARQYLGQARGYLPQLYRENPGVARMVDQHLRMVESGLNRLATMQWGTGSGRGLQTINPFGDYLFHDVPIQPSDGKLVTRHFDPQGIAARAEEWAKGLRDITQGVATRQGEERQKFMSELNEKLKLAGLGSEHQLQLSDIGGGQELKRQSLGDDLSFAGLPKLEGDTPALLRDPFGRDDPTIAPVSGKPSIDDIYVPLPPPTISAVDACAGGAACIVGALASEGMQWLQDKAWDAKVWYNDPMHQGWVSDAVMIGTAPLIVRDAFAVGSRIILGAGTADASLIAADVARNPNILSGHGALVVGDSSPVMVVPKGTSVTLWEQHGYGITDAFGNAIETGKPITMAQFGSQAIGGRPVTAAELGGMGNEVIGGMAGARTYLPGSVMPNYTLFPPGGLNIMGNPTTVTTPTNLSTLVRPGMGNVNWAACCVITPP